MTEEEIKAYRKRWYEEHREQCIAAMKRWKENNPDKVARQHRRYYLEHGKERNRSEAYQAYHKKYYQEHREAILEYMRKRREKQKE